MSNPAYERLVDDDASNDHVIDMNIADDQTPTGTDSKRIFSDIPLTTDDGSTTATTGEPAEEDEFPDYIRLVEIGKPRRTLNVDFRWTVTEFKERFFIDEMNRQSSVRLIYQGRLIQDDSATLSSYNIVQNGFVHAVVTQTKGQQSMPGFQQPQTQSGCSHDTFDNGLLTDEQLARQLQNEGRDTSSIFVPIGRGGRLGRDNEDQGNNPSEFACGFITGLLLGIWAFLFLLSPRWRHSRRFRSGVILGLLVNVVVTIAQHRSS